MINQRDTEIGNNPSVLAGLINPGLGGRGESQDTSSLTPVQTAVRAALWASISAVHSSAVCFHDESAIFGAVIVLCFAALIKK